MLDTYKIVFYILYKKQNLIVVFCKMSVLMQVLGGLRHSYWLEIQFRPASGKIKGMQSRVAGVPGRYNNLTFPMEIQFSLNFKHFFNASPETGLGYLLNIFNKYWFTGLALP